MKVQTEPGVGHSLKILVVPYNRYIFLQEKRADTIGCAGSFLARDAMTQRNQLGFAFTMHLQVAT